MALPPFRLRLILRQPDDPACDELIHAVAKKLRKPIPQVEPGVIEDPGVELVSFYVGTQYDDPVRVVTEALDECRPDWRDYIELRHTP